MADVPRTTGLVLTEKQERDLVDYAIQRIDGLRMDNNDRLKADRLAWEWYNNCRKERVQSESVFAQSNLVLPLTSMIEESFIARAEDEITGSEPFFRFRPRGASDADEVKQKNAYYGFKFGPEGANVKATFENAYEAIFNQRAAVFKIHWKDQTADWLDGSVKILTSKIDRKPIRKLANGKAAFITEDEARWRKVPQPGMPPAGEGMMAEAGAAPMMPGAAPEAAMPMEAPMMSVLEDDESIVWNPDEMEFAPPPKALLRQEVLYRGAYVTLLDYDAFMGPTNAASIEEMDFKCHVYDKPLSWVRGMFLERPWLTWRNFSAAYRAAKAKPQTKTERNEESKEELEFDEKTRSLPLIECWVRRNILGWEKPQEFMVLIEPEQKRAVYYEFQAAICPDRKSPFVSIAIAPHKNRWWGYNLPEKIEQYQDYADKQFNRASVRNARNANAIATYDPDAVEEEPDDIALGDGGLFRRKPGKNVRDFIDFAEIPDLDDRTVELLSFIIRMLQLWLSVSNLSQGDIQDIPEDTTKYAAQASLREASKLGRRWIRRIIRGFEEVLRKMVKLQANNIDAKEAYELLEGQVSRVLEMTPEELQSADLDVSLVLGTQLTEMEIQAADKALEVQDRYFATPDPMKKAKRPLLARILEALDFQDIDTLLPLPPEPPIDPATGLPMAMPGALGMGGEAMPAGPAAPAEEAA